MYIAFAPLQGYIDAIYRRAHWECVGGVDEYYTPFVRIEKGEIRRKDLRDTDPERNVGVPTVPQVIASGGDEFARLCDALQEGRLGGAGLDVTDPEPLPKEHRLWDMPNVVVTPHISGFYHLRQTYERIVGICLENLTNYRDGKPLRNIVDEATGYRALREE